MVDGAKLGGILVETHRGRTGCDAVIGIGINLRLPDRVSSAIEQPWTDLSGQAGFELPGRNALIAALVEELLSGIATSGRSLADFVGASWLRWDLLKGRDVRVERGGTMFSGKAMGITGGGALRLCVTPANGVGADGEFMEFHSGEVSVRHA